MNKLISLEVKRNRLRPYHIAVLIGGFTLLAFHYFMAAIPLIDPTEADIAMFSSYDFLINLNHLVSMAIFGILGAVMGTRFVIAEYSGAKAILLFSYPIRRKKMMGAMPRANKAVKSSENGVTRYVAGYTVFFLCSELFRYL